MRRGWIYAVLLLILPAAGVRGAEAPLSPVLARLAQADTGGALQALQALPADTRATPGARYLQARLLARLGRLPEALHALPTAADGLPQGMEMDIRERRARWLARSGRCGEALPLLERLLASPAHKHSALTRLRAAECALVTGNAEHAASELAAVDTRGRFVDAVAVGLTLAEAQAAQGDTTQALGTLRALWIDRPEHHAIEAVAAAMQSLGGAPKLSFQEQLTRAQKLSAARQSDAALQALKGLRPRTRAERAAMLHVRGMALYKLRTRYDEAARTLDRAARLGGAHAAQDAFHGARALSRANHNRRAARAYRRFAKRYPDSKRVPQAQYLAAWLDLRSGSAAGRKAMAAIVAKGQGYRRAALFQLGLDAFGRKRYQQASRYYEDHGRRGSGGEVLGRGLYWAARSAELGGQPQRALALYMETIGVEPLHWYALWARERLLAAGNPVPPPFPEAEADRAEPPSKAIAALELPASASFFARLGLHSDAVGVLTKHEAQLRQSAEAGRDLEALVRTYQDLGEYARPYQLVRKLGKSLLSEAPRQDRRWVWNASYARPYLGTVRALEQSEALPPDYLFAIMRKESSFDPSVVSYADAVGLMQLLPTTAQKVAQGMGLSLGREQLFDPGMNLRLSARLNATLLKRFKNESIYAIAAYNAGAHRVEPWIRREQKRSGDGPMELDLFVERIPIDQTRNYVRRVTTNWARYRYLATGDWPELLSSARRRR